MGDRKRRVESSPFPDASLPRPSSFLRRGSLLSFPVASVRYRLLAILVDHPPRTYAPLQPPLAALGVVGQRRPFPWMLLVHRCTQTAHQATHNTPLIPIKRLRIRKWTNVWTYAQAPSGPLALPGQTPRAIRTFTRTHPLFLASDSAFAGCISTTDHSSRLCGLHYRVITTHARAETRVRSRDHF